MSFLLNPIKSFPGNKYLNAIFSVSAYHFSLKQKRERPAGSPPPVGFASLYRTITALSICLFKCSVNIQKSSGHAVFSLYLSFLGSKQTGAVNPMYVRLASEAKPLYSYPSKAWTPPHLSLSYFDFCFSP